MAKIQFFPERDVIAIYMHGLTPVPFVDIVRAQAPWAHQIVEVAGGWKAIEAHDPTDMPLFIDLATAPTRECAELIAPWAAEIIGVDGGWQIFRLVNVAQQWQAAQ